MKKIKKPIEQKIPDCCPMCGIKTHQFVEGFQRHCVQMARHEVWQKAIGSMKETPHFDYYFKNTQPKTITTKRTWKF